MKHNPVMRYGFYLPTRGPLATRDGVLTLAREGERLGLHSAMIADHVVFPVTSESEYPYTLDGKHPSGGDALETFSILGVVAGATEKLRLVTSVLILPYRNPVLTAKMVASLDVLSGGRVTLGVGVGWLKEEFEALKSPDFERRGAVTDEWIAILKQLWTQSPATFRGRFYDYADIHISYKAPIYDAGVPDRSGNRRSFTGTAEQIADDVRAFGKIGVHELIFDFRGQSMAESIERLQRFAAEVKPLV